MSRLFKKRMEEEWGAGFNKAAFMRDVKAAWHENPYLTNFISLACSHAAGAKLLLDDFYDAYRKWTRETMDHKQQMRAAQPTHMMLQQMRRLGYDDDGDVIYGLELLKYKKAPRLQA